ncbi:MAG: tautomerase family protein, partial [Proteobacteria bacterium]
MPFIRTFVPKGTKRDFKQGIVECIHKALVDAIKMPTDELFKLITDYELDDFHFDRRFNGVVRSDQLIVIEITMRRGRSDAMKKFLYAEIAKNLQVQLAVSPSDIFIFMHENDYSDWS